MLFLAFLSYFSLSSSTFTAELESTTAWEPIRVCFEFDIANEEKKAVVKETTDNIARYLSKLLKVHPVRSINLKTNEFWEEKTITNCDMYIKIITYEFDVSTIASTGAYIDSSNDYRIKAGYIKLSNSVITTATDIDDKPRDFFNILIHEVFHALGIAQGHFDKWIDPDANKPYYLSGVRPFHYCTFPNISREFFFCSTKQIREFIKDRYGDDDFGLDINGDICPTGIEFEDDGGEGSKWKHPESRVFPGEIMSANHKDGETRYISEITLIMLKSTGWYEVDMSMAEPIVFGTNVTNDGEKIKKFMVGPPQTTWPDRYQCFAERFNYNRSVLAFGTCYPDLLSTAKCDLMTHSCPNGITDVCSNLDFVDPLRRGVHGKNNYFDYVAVPEIKRSCRVPYADDDNSQIPVKLYGAVAGDSSVCQISNIRKRDQGSYPDHLEGNCYHIECDYDFSSYTIRIADNSTGVCREKGQKLTFPDSVFNLGYIECTDPYWTCYNNYGFKRPDEVVWPATSSPTASVSQTPLASQSPMATETPTPMPSMSRLPDATDDYINKVFRNDVPNGQIEAGSSNSKQISGCQFIDISEDRDYFIKVVGDVSFFGNHVENSNYRESSKSPGVFWASNNNGKLLIFDCTFVKVNGRGMNGNILTTDEQTSMEIVFQKCSFIDCSDSSTRPLVNLRKSGSGSIQFIQCSFNFNDPYISCKVVDVKTSNVDFEECRFENCGTNTINVNIPSDTELTDCPFKFNKNYVRNNNGKLINAINIKSSIEFTGNTFNDNDLTDLHFIYISHNQNKLDLIDNTFSNMKSRGEVTGGGIASVFPSSSSEFSLTFTNCIFTDIINLHSTSPTFQGGAIQFGFSSFDVDFNVNTEIKFEECKFIRNEAMKHGGAISIQTAGKVYIKNCLFDENKANCNGNMKTKNLYNDRFGLGGAVYINPTFTFNNNDYYMIRIEIDECLFNKNSAHNGYAIYISGETSDNVYINFFLYNNFTNNFNTRFSPGNGANIVLEMKSKNVNEEYLKMDNRFMNDELGTDAKVFLQIDSSYVENEPTIVITEAITDPPTKEITEKPPVVITEQPTKEITEKPPGVITDPPTKEITEKPPGVVTDPPTKEITEKPPGVVTDPPTKEITEKPPGVVTDPPTKEITEKATEVQEIPTPVPIVGPVVDDNEDYQSYKESITFKAESFVDGNEEKPIANNDADIVLIKCNSQRVTLQVSSESTPVTNKFISVNQPNTVIEIKQTQFDNNEIGLHANSKNPTIQMQTTSIPLNVYVNEESTITLNTSPQPTSLSLLSESDSISIGEITSVEGSLKLLVSPGISKVITKKIDFYTSGKIGSYTSSSTSLIETATQNLNLIKESTVATVTNLNIINDIHMSSNSQLIVTGRVSFDSTSKVLMSDRSFIDLGDSVVEGLVQSIQLLPQSKGNLHLNEERKLICGTNFNCSEWTDKFTGNDFLNQAKCGSNEKGQHCLIAFSDKEGGPGNGEGDGKGNNNTTLIIIVVCVVVVIAVVVAIVVVIVIKKKNGHKKNSSDFLDNLAETNNNNEFDI